MFSWKLKRQFIAIAIIAVVVVIIVAIIIYLFSTFGSCTDGILNQDEERTDCGGSCAPCLDVTVKDPTILWARFFEISPGVYDVAARVRNTNQIAGGTARYTFTLRDASGNAIQEVSDVTTLFPGEDHVFFKANISTAIQPATVSVAVVIPDWKRVENRDIPINIVSQEFVATPAPRLSAVIENQSLFPVDDFLVTALVQDAVGNVIGVSQTVVDRIIGEGRDEIIFTWPATSGLQNPARINFLLTPEL